jgi:hypothetical protein
MITGSVKLTNRMGLGKAFVLDHLARTVAETGRDIAQTTRENMTPGHFLDTGLSQDQTRWSQVSPLAGAVQVPTEYAAYPEFGTSRMAARPVLVPAILQHWPSTLHKNWNDPLLPEVGPITGPVPPVGRP